MDHLLVEQQPTGASQRAPAPASWPKTVLMHSVLAGSHHPRCAGLRDYYPFWREQGESDTSGKLLLLDRSRTEYVFPPIMNP